MKISILAAVAATTFALGTASAFAGDAVQLNEDGYHHTLPYTVTGERLAGSEGIQTGEGATSNAFAASGPSDTVSGQQEHNNDVWSVIRSQRPL